MTKEELDFEMKRLIKELAVSATLTCNLYDRAKKLSEEIEKNA